MQYEQLNALLKTEFLLQFSSTRNGLKQILHRSLMKLLTALVKFTYVI